MKPQNFYTSDLHIDHHKLYETGFRIFSCAQACQEFMLENFNSRVGKEDKLYILGDLTLNASYDTVAEYLSQLNGIKIIIIGNHDKQKMLQRLKDDKIIANFYPWKGCHDNGVPVFMTHFVPLEAHVGPEVRLHLHGHVHGMLKNVIKCPLLYDVGVDANNFTPVSLADLNLELIERVRQNTTECPYRQSNMLCTVCKQYKEILTKRGRLSTVNTIRKAICSEPLTDTI